MSSPSVVVQDLATQWIQSDPCNSKTSQETESQRGNQKSFTLTMPKNLAKPLKIFRGIIVRQHHTDQKQMGLHRERYAE